jgi:hypothetical protein
MLLLMLSACGSTEADDAHDALRRWREEGPRSYVYVSNGYKWAPDSQWLDTDSYDRAEWRVVVKNRQVVSVSAQVTGHPLSGPALNMDDLLKRVIFYMEDGGYGPEDYEAGYDGQWGYVKHFEAGVDTWTFIDVSCLEPSTSDDACPVQQVEKENCSTEPVAVSAKPFDEVARQYEGDCDRTERFTKVRGEDLMCCRPWP